MAFAGIGYNINSSCLLRNYSTDNGYDAEKMSKSIGQRGCPKTDRDKFLTKY